MKRILIFALVFTLLLAALPVVGFADEPAYEMLKTGSSGDAVKQLQMRLIELNCLESGQSDGSFGKKTADAVSKFQAYVGLPETGEADDATQKALFAEDARIVPDVVFSLKDRNGKTWDIDALSDYKVIMLNFWETWCEPCRREMPDLEKLYQDYKERGFLILGLFGTGMAVNHDPDALIEAAEDEEERAALRALCDQDEMTMDELNAFLKTYKGSYIETSQKLFTGDEIVEELSMFYEIEVEPDYTEVDGVINETGVTYPNLWNGSAMDFPFYAGGFPTTIFIDGAGRMLKPSGRTTILGMKSYKDWAAIVEQLLPE